MKRTASHSKSYQREYKEQLPANTRIANFDDFKMPTGAFNCRYRKYYYWCRGNNRWMYWYTFPFDNEDDMKSQIDRLRDQVKNKELLVDA